MIEIWKHILDFPRYKISDQGRMKNYITGQIIETQSTKTEARLTPLSDRQHEPGNFPRKRIHILVLEAFHGSCPPGMECRHLNDDPSDNRLVNLRWGTNRENKLDRVRNGCDYKWFKKLSDREVRDIRATRAKGEIIRVIAANYGVHYHTIRRICSRHTYKDVA